MLYKFMLGMSALGATSAATVTPVQKVIEMLQDMAAKGVSLVIHTHTTTRQGYWYLIIVIASWSKRTSVFHLLLQISHFF